MDKPMLFSTPMVQAISDDRKTQTRRIVKPQPPRFIDWFEKRGNGFKAYMAPGEPCDFPVLKSPYQPGDILWVKETAYLYGHWVKNGTTKTGKQKWKFIWDKTKPVYYEDSKPEVIKKGKEEVGYFKRPSIFMPKKAARLFLRVTNIRMERLQDITEEDARAEGIEWTDEGPLHAHYLDRNVWLNFATAREAFKSLWDGLNAKRGYGWDTNPWVWVIEFKRVEGDINAE